MTPPPLNRIEYVLEAWTMILDPKFWLFVEIVKKLKKLMEEFTKFSSGQR